MLVKVLVYGYATGVFSSHKIARKLFEDVAFRMLGAGNFPSHRTICDFRVRHLSELTELFVQVVRLARELGLVKLGVIGLDGTKIKANASKHKAMSYGRMKEQEQELRREIEALLERARTTDAQEDRRFGVDQADEELPLGIEQCYNAQAAVDGQSRIIVASAITNNAADNGELLPMMEAVKKNVGRLPERALADAGYRSEQAFAVLEEKGVEVLVALGREGKQQATIDPKFYPASARMAERLASPEGMASYRRRKVIPEPVFGWIKHVLGFRQFSLRGLSKVRGEWSLVCLAINVRRLWVLGT
jgi:hypothetical protein